MTSRLLLAAAVAGLAWVPALGQAPPPAGEPDVAIVARVRAKQLRFEIVPNVTVTFPSQPQNITVWHTDRENLPSPVQPFVTYRDIGIRLTITSTLPNIEQILDEALGPQPKAQTSPPQQKP